MKAAKKLFMSCSWTNLLYVNFKIDKEIINSLLPKDLEADLFDGEAILSFVGFRFTNASFYGIKIPFHQYFSEINLRTYVRNKKNHAEKGIYFISEMVPKFMTYFVGKFIYGEPFKHINVQEINENNSFGYEICNNDNRVNLSCIYSSKLQKRQQNREEEFIIDRVFAYCGKVNSSHKKYEVTHQKWNLLEISDCKFSVNNLSHLPASIQKFLEYSQPFSIFATDGSAVNVFRVYE